MSLDPLTAILDFGGKVLERVIPDPTARAAAQVELAKLQESGELARLAADTELTKAAYADTASARERESAIATSETAPYISKIITPLLALVVTIGGGVMLALTPDAEVKYAVVSVMTLVLGYYFGTSQGSTKAAQMMRDLVRKPPAPL